MSRFSSDRIQALQLDSWRRCIRPPGPRRFRSCDSTLRGGFHCLFPLSCFVVSCQPGQAAVRKVPARALWLEVLRRTWDATRCASKVRSQMTDGPHGYLRSDTNDTMLTLVFAWFRRSVALKLCILFASLQSLDVSWPSVVICGDLWCELLSGASIR